MRAGQFDARRDSFQSLVADTELVATAANLDSTGSGADKRTGLQQPRRLSPAATEHAVAAVLPVCDINADGSTQRRRNDFRPEMPVLPVETTWSH